jgi:hypothetical protein
MQSLNIKEPETYFFTYENFENLGNFGDDPIGKKIIEKYKQVRERSSKQTAPELILGGGRSMMRAFELVIPALRALEMVEHIILLKKDPHTMPTDATEKSEYLISHLKELVKQNRDIRGGLISATSQRNTRHVIAFVLFERDIVFYNHGISEGKSLLRAFFNEYDHNTEIIMYSIPRGPVRTLSFAKSPSPKRKSGFSFLKKKPKK